MMSWITSWHLFWAILLGFCTATPKILTSDHSCPCRSSSQCPDHSQRLYEGSQVTITPCESEHLIRCCSVTSNPIEKELDLIENATEISGKNQTSDLTSEEDLNEKSIQLARNDNLTTTDENLKEGTTIENSLLKEDVFATNTKYESKESSRQFPEPPKVRYRIFNEVSSNASSSIRFAEEMHEGAPEVSLTEQELDLIDKVMSFESTKTSVRKRDASEATMKENKENVTRKINLFFPRKINFNKDHRFDVNFKSLSSAKSVASEKMSNLLKRKTSLETSLTLDRVSTRAINENAKPPSILARLRNSDTSIRNLSHPEGAENVNRTLRRYTFLKFGNMKILSSPSDLKYEP